MVGTHRDRLGIAALFGHRQHPVADPQAGHRLAERRDYTGRTLAGDEGKRRQKLVCAADDQEVGVMARLTEAGIVLADRHADAVVEEVEAAIADAAPLTRTINAWEGRWPLNTYRDRDSSKLSRSALDRLAMAEAMTLADYGSAIAVRRSLIRD
jgi:hypothetical protein